ncbi:HAD hydrolase-like protein [Alicyclobacillus fastidiosus]|uniref:HAD hydrolase-like protein n=1 Tax=Alicyclobacillus fastidiosus TaxID=392011 RepID=A0ABY6ZK29_9BACL|nr:HAD hydrolase-like protein [Alicyclobacillus fastidiosus]WAH43201.1 HAD hydrolase-like protein [Alicyclobacillus fastidiosus]GMA65233.1 MTA/SAH nucleosidase [Alicyclobacillus fastidiosus]
MNSKRNRPQAIIFDLDGTLFQTESLSIPAYHATFAQLRSEGLFSGETPPESLFLNSLGLLLEEIWVRVMPNSSQATRHRANELLLSYQLQFLADGYGAMYPHVTETLEQLHKRGYQLFVASNGLESYVRNVIEHMSCARLFSGLYSAGEFQTASKVDLVGLVLCQHRLASAWMCGDRYSDIEAGQMNDLPTVGCDYGGFAGAEELQGADFIIHAFSDLLHLLEF